MSFKFLSGWDQKTCASKYNSDKEVTVLKFAAHSTGGRCGNLRNSPSSCLSPTVQTSSLAKLRHQQMPVENVIESWLVNGNSHKRFHKSLSRPCLLLDQPTKGLFSKLNGLKTGLHVTFHNLGETRSCFGKGHRRLSCFLGSRSVSHEVQAAEHTGNSETTSQHCQC